MGSQCLCHHITPSLGPTSRGSITPNSQVWQGGVSMKVLWGCQGKVAKIEAKMQCGAAGCRLWNASTNSVQ